MGFSPKETVVANQLDFQLKLMIQDGVGSLCCVAYACWEDPDQQRDEQEWRMLQIVLVKVTDPTAKIPARYTGPLQLTLNTSYLQKGQVGVCSDDPEVKWYSYVTTLPAWATERGQVSENLSLPGWVNEEAFKMMKEHIIQHNKLVRLADQGGQTEDREKPGTLFPAGAAKKVLLSLYDKKLS